MRCNHQDSFFVMSTEVETSLDISETVRDSSTPLGMTIVELRSRLSVLLDKFRSVKPAGGVFAVTRADEGREELAHFKMKMGKVTAVGGADCGDLLAAFHEVARMDEHVPHMPVIRLHVFPLAIFGIGVEPNHNVAPTRATVRLERDATDPRRGTPDNPV